MKTTKYFLSVILLSLASLSIQAQTVESAYFTDGFLYRHCLNPALVGDSAGYIALPALGNLNLSMAGNIGVQDFLFQRNGATHTFLSPQVSASDFLGGIHDVNRLNQELNLQIIGFGFRAFHGYNTFEVNLRENIGLRLPGSLLELAKTGLQNQSYDISNFSATATSYAEIALGHSHRINNKLTLGAKLKFLIGGANVSAKVNTGTITLGEDGYTALVDAQVDASVKGLEYKTTTTQVKTPIYDAHHQVIDYKQESRQYINDIDIHNTGINGMGIAVDLGATYQLARDWNLSASLLDVGFIRWKENHRATSHGEVNTNDYVFNTDDQSRTSFDNMMDVLGDDLSKVYQLQEEGGSSSRTTMLGATMHIGAEYTAPFYRRLTFGLLNTTRIQGDYSWTNFRLSANVAPCKVLSAGANIATGTFGMSLGGIVNFHCKGFNLFLATDHAIGKMAKQGVPLSSNGNISTGINFPF